MSGGDSITGARVLIVDDQPANVVLLTRILEREGFALIKSTTDPREVVPLFAAFDPDIVLLDLHMPHRDGFEVMQDIERALGADAFVPTVVLTADVSTPTRDRALSLGANDFLTKPFDPREVVLRVRNLLTTRARYVRQEAALSDARVEVLDRLARAVDLRDNETFAHTQRVGDMSARLASRLALPPDQVELLRRAAPLHDIGKIGIRDEVLLKPGRLTGDEFAHVRTHTTIGADLLAGSTIPVLQMARLVAVGHHERWDGNGYPQGLAGTAIPVEARIVAVADVFDALTHDRPYKTAWSVDEAVAEIVAQRAKHFDPDVVDVFLGLVEADPSSATASPRRAS